MLLELAILRLLSRNLTPGSNGGSTQFAHKPGHLKAVYLAPSRALVQARAAPLREAPQSGSWAVCCREPSQFRV